MNDCIWPTAHDIDFRSASERATEDFINVTHAIW